MWRGSGLLALAALVLTLLPAPARSELILVDNTTSAQTDYWNVNGGNGPVYGKFTVTQGGSVSSASVLLARDSYNAPYDLAKASVAIVDDNGGSPGTLLGTSNSGSGTLANNGVYVLVNLSFATPIDLNPGSYWLRLTSTDSAEQLQWGTTPSSSLLNTGTSGTVTTPALFSFSGSLQTDPSSAYIFRLNGSPLAAVPEPGTLASGGLGTLLVLARVYRRRHRQPVAA